jgi:hypothetical protein
MASLLLDEDPAARHKPAHMGDSSRLPSGTLALRDELNAEINDDEEK